MAKTPMMQQYLDIKSQYTDAILFFRLGDFYEMFYDDARLVSRELDLTLTGKDCGEEERAPMCGIPFHAADGYIGRLVRRGYKVVICEQTEDPAQAKGLVKREVVRIVTPGTAIESSCLSDDQNNFLCVLYLGAERAGLCFCDVSTGEVHATCLSGERPEGQLLNELATFSPRELLLNCSRDRMPSVADYFVQNHGMICDNAAAYFEDGKGSERIFRAFGKTPAELDLQEPELVAAIGGLTAYINEMQKTDTSYLKSIRVYRNEQYLGLDYNTRRNLELCETMRQKERRGSLFGVLDRTRSAMGARLLRKWLEMPLLDVPEILRRQNAVRELHSNYLLRQEIADAMRDVLDLERLMTRVIYGTSNARDLLAVLSTLEAVPRIREQLSACTGESLRQLLDEMDPLDDIRELIASAVDPDAPLTVREGKMIKRGYSADVDALRSVYENSEEYMRAIETRERESTNIRTLKVAYNRVFGFYIEVSKSFIGQVPETYIRKQTLTNCERYFTQELKELESTVLGAQDKLAAIEYELFCSVRNTVAQAAQRIQRTAEQLALLDVYQSLADVAERNHYVCPEVEYSEVLSIKEGRHPVVETTVTEGGFVPNDTYLDTENNRLALITGPNMAGKSTYMRQVALIVIMAQIGSFVPAADARIGLVDRIFTRVGASDDLASGQSTFMLEMNEVAYILKNATRRSLIVYDEIGRGTSTFDGMSIAQAVAEYTLGKKVGAKTLFATHYHELTEMAKSRPGVVNYFISARKRGDDIIFLRKIMRGAADDSYGIEVAKLAGVPNEVIRRAKQILSSLEAKSSALTAAEETADDTAPQNVTFDDYRADEIREKLQKTDVDSMSPRDALDLLYELKRLADR